MNWILGGLLVLALTLAGCATTSSAGANTSAKIDYGAYPENYERLIKDHFNQSFPEPSAAEYRFGKPFAGYTVAGPLMGGKALDAGYFVEVWVKAKDRTGNYLPERQLGVLIKNGEVLMQLSPSELGSVQRAP